MKFPENAYLNSKLNSLTVEQWSENPMSVSLCNSPNEIKVSRKRIFVKSQAKKRESNIWVSSNRGPRRQ